MWEGNHTWLSKPQPSREQCHLPRGCTEPCAHLWLSGEHFSVRSQTAHKPPAGKGQGQRKWLWSFFSYRHAASKEKNNVYTWFTGSYLIFKNNIFGITLTVSFCHEGAVALMLQNTNDGLFQFSNFRAMWTFPAGVEEEIHHPVMSHNTLERTEVKHNESETSDVG